MAYTSERRVGRGDRAERLRVVDVGREEVHGLDEREIVGERNHTRIVERLAADEQPRIVGARGKRRERVGQVTRTPSSTLSRRRARTA
jgi:hypothetical protein